MEINTHIRAPVSLPLLTQIRTSNSELLSLAWLSPAPTPSAPVRPSLYPYASFHSQRPLYRHVTLNNIERVDLSSFSITTSILHKLARRSDKHLFEHPIIIVYLCRQVLTNLSLFVVEKDLMFNLAFAADVLVDWNGNYFFKQLFFHFIILKNQGWRIEAER